MESSLSIPKTKFRAPRLRDEVIERERLASALAASVMERSVTLISAAAGYGKTTLLSQLASMPGLALRLVWVSLDEEDNDVHRFTASLCNALDELDLIWDLEPETLLRQFGSDGRNVKQVVSLVVNALCSNEQQRIAIVLDDLHRVTDEAVLSAVEHLVERLPQHVGLVIASREVPALPFAKLRARGALGEFRPDDLRFTADEAQRYLARKMRTSPQQGSVKRLIDESEGWPVGLVMIAETLRDDGDASGELEGLAQRLQGAPQVFDFLAQEVLQALPADMQQFVVHCSVLPELSPAMCSAVSGRGDAGAVLEQLYRRNLFVTMLDPATPVMRFHDLFREFLQHRLLRDDAALARELHARAAQAEARPSRAIAHWLAAEQWDKATAQIASQGLRYISEGSALGILRLVYLLPMGQRENNPNIQLLLGICSYMRWDMAQTNQHSARAIELYARQADAGGLAQAMVLRVSVLMVLGHLDQARALLDQCLQTLPPDHDMRAVTPIFSLWLDLNAGKLGEVARWFEVILRIAHSDKAKALFSRMVSGGQFHMMLGVPGATRFLDEFSAALLRYAAQESDRAMEATGLYYKAWCQLWKGHIADAARTAAAARNLNLLAGGLKGLALSGIQLDAFLAALKGNAADCEDAIGQLSQVLSAVGVAHAHAGGYFAFMVRVYWMLGQPEPLAQTCTRMIAAQCDTEWPNMRGGRPLGQAYVAIGRRDHAAAQALLEVACAEQAAFPMPGVSASARVALAYNLALQGRAAEAWSAFKPLLQRVAADDDLGFLLLDSKQAVAMLLALEPPGADDLQLLDAMRQRYRTALLAEESADSRKGPADRLTSRELQILQLLAAGASNKRIASDLFLSVHTVKRHVANIIGKLEVATRGQAAALHHQMVSNTA